MDAGSVDAAEFLLRMPDSSIQQEKKWHAELALSCDLNSHCPAYQDILLARTASAPVYGVAK